MTMFCLTLITVIFGLVAFTVHNTHALLGIPSFLEFGSCAEVKLKENFDPVKYSGLWFDIETVPNEYQHTKKCVTQNYTWTGTQMNVATRGLTADDTKVQQSAVMVQDEEFLNQAAMLVHAAGVPEAPYQVISTDYSTFSCVYSCIDGYAGFMAEFMWVFSRTPTLPVTKIQHCYDTFISMGCDPKKMVPVVQQHMCPYFERLGEILAVNKKHLLKVLGHDGDDGGWSPGSSPVMTTVQSSLTKQPEIKDNEIKGFHEEQQLLDMKHEREFGHRNHKTPDEGKVKKTSNNPVTGDKGESVISSQGSSGRKSEVADPNTSSSTPLPTITLFILAATTLLLHP